MPELTDLSNEPARVLDLYGPDARKPGSFAANCLLARRLAERGVRFIQLYHRGWDNHGGLPLNIPKQCKRHRSAAGRADSGSEAARACWTRRSSSGAANSAAPFMARADLQDNYGRDHHGRCFSHLAGRRRHQAGHRLRRDRRLRLQHRPRSGARSTISTRRCCIAWASITSG